MTESDVFQEVAEFGIAEERPPPLQLVLEVARLAAVLSYAVLDRSDIPELDGIAEAAARALGRPMGGVGFVDDSRVWFAGAHGLQRRETSRAESLWEQTIAQSSPLVVRDAAADPRFCNHPDVSGEGGIRFYAGVGVLDADKYRLGAICVFDQRPGEASVEGLSGLLRLGTLASDLLASRRAHADAARGGNGVQGWLGVRTRHARLRRSDQRPGLLVLSVAANSPADLAGVRPTDVLHAIDDQVLWNPPDVVSALANRPADSLARLQLLRAGQLIERVVSIVPERARAPVSRPSAR